MENVLSDVELNCTKEQCLINHTLNLSARGREANTLRKNKVKFACS